MGRAMPMLMFLIAATVVNDADDNDGNARMQCKNKSEVLSLPS